VKKNQPYIRYPSASERQRIRLNVNFESFADQFVEVVRRLYKQALAFGGNHMKPIITGILLLFFGVTVPAFAQEEHHEESAKPTQHEEQAKPAAKQEQAKPQKQEQQAKPAKQEQEKPEKQQQAAPKKQEQQAKSQKQNQQKQAQPQAKGQRQEENKKQQPQTKTQQNQQRQQSQATGHAQQSQAQYARSGQKDRYGHEYDTSHFGPNHHARFEASGGREYNGRREFSYGGYWFYAGAYPAWFYQQDVYFILGADGLWYAVAYGNPSLTFQINIE
jgi:flagellar biosynthesis GTPase FlhF